MSATFADATTACPPWKRDDERRTHVAPERIPLSINRRWCEGCRSWHMYAFLQRSSRKAWWTRKAKEVVVLFVIGEMIAVGILALAGGALAAMR
jgi:hypothetical protein